MSKNSRYATAEAMKSPMKPKGGSGGGHDSSVATNNGPETLEVVARTTGGAARPKSTTPSGTKRVEHKCPPVVPGSTTTTFAKTHTDKSPRIVIRVRYSSTSNNTEAHTTKVGLKNANTTANTCRTGNT